MEMKPRVRSNFTCGFESIIAGKSPFHDVFEQTLLYSCGNGNTVPLVTPGAGRIWAWGEFVTINPDPSTSRKQPWN